jgi:hypothetical protein
LTSDVLRGSVVVGGGTTVVVVVAGLVVLVPDGRLVVVTFDTSHFHRYWLNRYFPTIQAIDRRRFPDAEALHAELLDAGFGSVRFMRHTQHGAVSREQALERIRGRHISTFDLLDEEEIRTGTALAERELAERVEFIQEWLIAIAELRE